MNIIKHKWNKYNNIDIGFSLAYFHLFLTNNESGAMASSTANTHYGHTESIKNTYGK